MAIAIMANGSERKPLSGLMAAGAELLDLMDFVCSFKSLMCDVYTYGYSISNDFGY